MGAPPTSGNTAIANGWVERLTRYAERLERLLMRRLLVIGLLSLMVMIGLFLANYSSEKAHYYWVAMFPLFGIACLAHELASGRAYEVALWRVVLRQGLHWLGPIIAVKILFLQHSRGAMSTDEVALAVILVLAVTCFLAGVHFDQSFYWVAAILVLGAILGTEIETYLWLVVILMLVAGAIATLSAVLLHRGRAAAAASAPAQARGPAS
jgi:hypothetical protein